MRETPLSVQQYLCQLTCVTGSRGNVEENHIACGMNSVLSKMETPGMLTVLNMEHSLMSTIQS
jgi:hypothetical protein